MDRLFDKKSKKSLKISQQHTSLGIPANIAVGPLGFRADLDIGPKGEQGRSYHVLDADWLNLTVVLDEEDTRVSRIVFRENKGKGRALPAPETSTPGAVVGGDEQKTGPISECF